MSKKYLIVSTLTASVSYGAWNTDPDGRRIPVRVADVVIKGGAGVADARGDTPVAAGTEVSEEQFALLKNDPTFQRHQKAGFLKVTAISRDNEATAERAAPDMAQRDASAPETAETLAAQAAAAQGSGDGVKIDAQSSDSKTRRR